MQISHLAGMALFALLVSVGFASLGEQPLAARIRHGAWCFAVFMAVAVGIAWLLLPLSQ
jgi:hypothetical protein